MLLSAEDGNTRLAAPSGQSQAGTICRLGHQLTSSQSVLRLADKLQLTTFLKTTLMTMWMRHMMASMGAQYMYPTSLATRAASDFAHALRSAGFD